MRALCLLFAAAAAALGQIDPDTITVASRSSVSQPGPDTVDYDVDVNAAVGKGLDDVLKAVADAGVTERDLTGVSSSSSRYIRVCYPDGRGCSPTLTWSFRFSSQIAKLRDTLAVLARAAPAGMSVSYSAYSGGASPSLECAYPTLISQARRQAENLAAAAGLRVGRVTALSDAVDDPPTPVMVRTGVFFGVPTTLTGILYYAPPPYIPPPACAVAVQFQLLR